MMMSKNIGSVIQEAKRKPPTLTTVRRMHGRFESDYDYCLICTLLV